MIIGSANRPLRVFLCHGSEDKTTVRELYSKLREDGIQPWLDEKDLLPGQDWDDEIRRAVKNSDAILVCLSSKSVRKEGYIQKEIRFALDVADEKPEGTIFVIPINLDGCELPRRLIRWQYVDYREEDSYSKILCALKVRADELCKTTQPGKATSRTPLRPISNLVIQSSFKKNTRTAAERSNIFESKRGKIIQSLEERYRGRYDQKLDERITLNLQLRYTEEGTTQHHALRYFAKDAKSILRLQSELTGVLDEHRYLLIVGDPGAGKTTILLDIAISLLSEARANKSIPIPIIFNLASWRDKNIDFSQWLEDMLVQGNNFSRRLARKAIEGRNILPLLDGFDEIGHSSKDDSERESRRSDCLVSINNFMAKYEPDKLVICSRIGEYKSTLADAPVKAEIMVEPLEIAQVQQALHLLSENSQHNSPHPFANITAAQNIFYWMERNPAFARLLQTPFYFNLALQTLYTQNVDDVLPQEETSLSQYLIEKFVEIKLTQLSDKKFPSSEKNKFWLFWLAKMLNKRNEVIFELSTLQPSRLSSPKRYRFALSFAVTYVVVSYLGCSIGLIMLLDSNIPIALGSIFVISSPVFGLFFAQLIGLIGKFGGWSENYDFKTEDIRQWKLSKAVSIQAWMNTLISGLNGFGRGLMYGLIIGLSFGLLTSVNAPSLEPLRVFIIVGLMLGSLGGLCFGLVTGFLNELSTIRDFAQIRSPGQKLKGGLLFHPLKWSLILSIVVFVLTLLVVEAPFMGINHPISFILYFGIFGLIVGFLSTPFFKHCVLRYYLYREGFIPLRYVGFLNYATKLRILERDGGQWRFRHQILQDHFAGLNLPDPPLLKYFY